MSKKKKDHKPREAGVVFNYTSKCCEDRKENKFSECNLGHWRCTKCGKGCKVSRTKVKEPDGGTGIETTQPE
jgi:hypothetical protein